MRNVKAPYLTGITVGYIAGFIGLLIHALVANSFIIAHIMEPFWFFTGVIAVLPALEPE